MRHDGQYQTRALFNVDRINKRRPIYLYTVSVYLLTLAEIQRMYISVVIMLQLQICDIIPGAARLGRRPTGVAHSKITRVRVLSWQLPVLTSLYFLTVTKSCHMKCDESLVFVVAEVVVISLRR